MGTRLQIKELTEAKGKSIGWLSKRAQLDYSVTHRYYHDKVKAWDRGVGKDSVGAWRECRIYSVVNRRRHG